jgi:uncharacterized protein with HEPN domain
MSKRDWKILAYDILESIRKIEKYIINLEYEKYIKDEKTKDAIVRNLEIIGEAANKIPPNIQEKYKEIPWSEIIGLRHRLIHGYFVIDYDIVWNIIKNELPDLKKKLNRFLKIKQ